MRNKDKNRAENYIKKHETYKKWLAFVLCLSLITGGVTLYMLNKPATAMTAEGAESVGLVIDTADAEFEQELINETLENSEGDTGDEDAEAETSEGSEMADAEEALDNPETDADSADEAAKETETADTDKVNEAAGTDSSLANAAENAGKDTSEKEVDIAALKQKLVAGEKLSDDEIALIKDAELSAEESELLANIIEEKELLAKEKESKLLSFKELGLDVPVKVNVADYVTETIIERKKSDGSWEVIAKEDVKEGDYVRITYKYDLPEEAKLSEDISMEIPEELNFVDIEKTAVLDGNGNVEVTGSNIKIEYNEETKQEIIDDAMESNLQASSSALQGVFASVNGGVLGSFFRLFAPLRVSAAEEGDGISTEGYVNKTLLGSNLNPGMTITDVHVAVNPEVKWKDNEKYYEGGTEITNGGEVRPGDILLFSLDYKLGIGTVDEDNRTITYDLNEQKITPAVGMSGVVYNNNNQAVGTFVVDQSGLVTITYDEAFAKKNKTQVVYGNFYFAAKVESDSTEDYETKVYKFNNEVKFTININKKKDSDLTLAKQASVYNEETGTISYILRATSTNGTGTEIVITDEMVVKNHTSTSTEVNSDLTQKISLSEMTDLEVKLRDNGYTRSSNVDTTGRISYDANNKMVLTLPALQAGENYKITYTYMVPVEIANTSEDLRLYNTITGKYDEKDSNEAHVHTSFHGDIPEISKKGEKVEGSDAVKWTITLNSEGKNLKGYTLQDLRHIWDIKSGSIDAPYKGDMTVSSVKTTKGTATLKEGDKITLNESGYTFTQDDYSTYVFTYIQNYSVLDLKYGSLKNEAQVYLDKPGNGKSSTSQVWIGNPDLVDKKAEGLTANSDGTYSVKWNVTIHAPIVPNEEDASGNKYWSFFEYIQDEREVFTDADVAAFTDAISKVYSGKFDVTKDKHEAVDTVNGHKRLQIRFYDELKEDISFSFSSTGKVSNVNSVETFTNKAYVYNQNLFEEASQNYEPVIQKFDGNNNASDSTYDYYTDALYREGILTWNIKVIVPKNTDYKTLYVVDSLPGNVTLLEDGTYNKSSLYGLSVAGDNSFNGAAGFENGSASYDGVSFSESVNGGNVTISFDAQAAAGKTLYFKVRAKINSDFDFDSVSKGEFENSVVLSTDSSGSKRLGSDSQKQYVTKIDQAMKKTGVELSDSINTVEYTLDINEGAADLLPEGNMLTLTDQLKAKSHLAFNANLIAGSLTVYEVTASEDGSESLRTLNSNEYTFTSSSYSTTSDEWDANYVEYCKIILQIPDEMHLRVKYQYTFDGAKDVEVKLSNDAILEGIAIENNSSNNSKTITLQEAGAKADVHGINLYKVDNENNALYLEGAEFYLYYWDSVNSEWVQTINTESVDGKFVSGADGLIVIGDLDYNRAYKLVEINAPRGYILKQTPMYFYMPSTDTDKYPMKLPSDFFKKLNGTSIVAGSNVNFTNEKESTSITIKKEWDNADGTMPDSISVKIGRRLGSESTEASAVFHTVNVERKNAQNYITQYIGYPSVKDGSTLTLTFYTFKDAWNEYPTIVTVDGQTLDYSSKLSNNGYQTISETITITEDTTITIKDNNSSATSSNPSAYPVTASIKSAETSTVSGLDDDMEDSEYKTIKLTKGDGWTNTVSDLEKYYLVKDESGNVTARYIWNYYVSEVNNVYYTASYSDNNEAGISSGTITITNTRNDVDAYSLPQTGGVGEKPFKAAGIGFITLAVFGGAVTLGVGRRKKKQS